MPDPIAASTIAQTAFTLMGKASIASFADDSQEAARAREQYPVALGMCLEYADWGFASKIWSLPPKSDVTDFELDPNLPNIYELPPSAIMLREVMSEHVPFRQDGRLIRAEHTDNLVVRVTCDVSDETALPATFRMAVSLQLAALLAPKMVESRAKLQDILAQLGEALDKAARTDARTASPRNWTDAGDNDWLSEATQ